MHHSIITPTSRGGRFHSPALRHSIQLSEEFDGLPEGTSRYDLLLLVKRAGKLAGFSSKMIQLLDYYFAFTRDLDWEEGRPLVYQCLAKTALDLGVTERHIQRLEQGLFEAGALTWNDSGNHRRYGKRCPKSGAILFAFGVDLSPLASLQPKLQALLDEKKLRDTAWLESKRQVSAYRSRIKGLLGELQARSEDDLLHMELEQAYQTLCVPIRTHLSLEKLRELLHGHQVLYAQVLKRIETAAGGGGMSGKESPAGDEKVVPIESTQQESFNELKGRRDASGFQERPSHRPGQTRRSGEVPIRRSEKPGGGESLTDFLSSKSKSGADRKTEKEADLRHITLKQVLNAASAEFRAHLPLAPRPMNWADVVEAAYARKRELRIAQEDWAEACQVLGRNGASLCLLLTDQAMLRKDDPVRKPSAYFRALIHRGRTGELDLRRSIFGLLKKEEMGDGGWRVDDGNEYHARQTR